MLQLAIILGTARVLSAGIALGPIVCGALAPDLHAFVFECSSLPASRVTGS